MEDDNGHEWPCDDLPKAGLYWRPDVLQMFFIGRVRMITLDQLDRQLAELRDKLLSLPSIEDWHTLSLAATNVALWDWKPQSGIIHLSPAWGRLLGIEQTGGAVRLGDYVQYVHPDDRPLLTLTMVGFVVAGGEYASRHRMLHRDGSQRRFFSRDVAVLPAHGHPAHVVVADFDHNAKRSDGCGITTWPIWTTTITDSPSP